MPTLTLRVSEELALQFAALAATEGGKSALIRRLLESCQATRQTAPLTP